MADELSKELCPEASKGDIMRNSAAYVGRVGGLAVALGIGTAVVTGQGLAQAIPPVASPARHQTTLQKPNRKRRTPDFLQPRASRQHRTTLVGRRVSGHLDIDPSMVAAGLSTAAAPLRPVTTHPHAAAPPMTPRPRLKTATRPSQSTPNRSTPYRSTPSHPLQVYPLARRRPASPPPTRPTRPGRPGRGRVTRYSRS